MKIVIFGLGKSGTTALFYKIKNSISKNIRCIFEPIKYEPQPSDNSKGVLAKVLINTENVDLDSFKNFDKKIYIVRDPRDSLISYLLYTAYFCFNEDKTNYLLKKYISILKKKENNPYLVSVLKIINLRPDKNKFFENLDLALDFNNNDCFTLKYEDFINGKLDELERYLGFILNGKTIVDRKHKIVERTKSYGDWKNWFTYEDIKFFKPKFLKFMEKYCYMDNWELEGEKIIIPEDCSEYVKKVIKKYRNEKRLMFIKNFLASLIDRLMNKSKIPNDFNWKTYINNYFDLQQAGITTKEKAVNHWLSSGRLEKRSYHAINIKN